MTMKKYMLQWLQVKVVLAETFFLFYAIWGHFNILNLWTLGFNWSSCHLIELFLLLAIHGVIYFILQYECVRFYLFFAIFSCMELGYRLGSWIPRESDWAWCWWVSSSSLFRERCHGSPNEFICWENASYNKGNLIVIFLWYISWNLNILPLTAYSIF